jgi:hypothetical protein
MTPQEFLEVTQASLLSHLGEELHKFFAPEIEKLDKASIPNPRSAIKPIAQLNMVANVTFHLMAQQLALVLHEMPELNREKVLKTTFENIRKLVNQYSKEIQKEEENGKTHGEGHPAGPGSPSGISH